MDGSTLTGHYAAARSATARTGLQAGGGRRLSSVLYCVAGVAGVAAAAALVHRFNRFSPGAALFSLAVVIAIAFFGGAWQAVIVCFSAAASNGFLAARQPGLRALVLPSNVALLAALLLVALVVSRLAARARAHAGRARWLDKQMRNLFEFSRRTLEMNLHIEPGPQLAEMVHDLFSLEGVVIFDADLHETYQAGYWGQDARELAQNVYYFESSNDDPATGLSRRVLRLGRVPVGSLVLRGETTPLASSAIALLIATTFDRYRAFANESQIEAERRAEQLRSTVLDSLAHAYKTPLTAIRAASTGLAEMGKLSASQSELVSLIGEQASVLGDLTTRLLTTARLESGQVALHREPLLVRSLIDDVVAGLKDRLASMKLSVQLDEESLELCCDRQLISALLTQYLDNACKYAIYGTTVTLAVKPARAEVVFSVHSVGPEIPTADHERIFDRYYRASTSSQRATGTGIGLAVAKRAAQLHGGHVWVTSDEVEGTTFFAAIPTAVLQKS
ncbi:MAG TPA: ATP-binding protein [Terracidiphilus sp.]|nr:ATP-binding protein [Terracidiphilus sp.]